MSAETKPLLAVRPGQLWKTEDGCILIIDQGDRVVGYKRLRHPNQRAALTNLIRPEALASYLSQVGARLTN